MSQLEVDKIIPSSGTTLTIGDSGDTVTIPSGATITNNGTATGFAPATGSVTNDMLSSGSFSNITGTGTLTNFTSTGIDDNATSTALTIASDGRNTVDSTNEKPLVIHHSDGSTVNMGFQNNSSNAHFLGFTSSDLVLAPAGTERTRVTNSGDLVMGKTNPAFNNTEGVAIRNFNAIQVERANACLDLNRMNTNGSIVIFYRGATNVVGSISADGSSTSYNTSSDHRLKENVIDLADATTRVKQLQPKRFSFIADETNTLKDGFLAHEVSSVVPEAITGTHNGVKVWGEDEELPEGVSVGDNKLDDEGNTIPEYQGIDQSKLVPLLTASLKEALTEIDNLKARIEALENA